MCQNHYSTSPWCLAMSLSCSCNENFNKTWSRMPNKRKIWNLRQEKRKAKVCPAHQRNDFNNSFTSLFIIKGSRTTAPPPPPPPPQKKSQKQMKWMQIKYVYMFIKTSKKQILKVALQNYSKISFERYKIKNFLYLFFRNFLVKFFKQTSKR